LVKILSKKPYKLEIREIGLLLVELVTKSKISIVSYMYPIILQRFSMTKKLMKSKLLYKTIRLRKINLKKSFSKKKNPKKLSHSTEWKNLSSRTN